MSAQDPTAVEIVEAPARTPFLDRAWVAPAFFAATLLSIFFVGMENAAGYYAMIGEEATLARILAQALVYTGALVAILGCHEMGHWLTARAHGVRTSLPVFIPMPFGLGTFGAVIAMRQLPPDRTSLLRIGAAGPLAGGVVALALMAIAVQGLPVVVVPDAATSDVVYLEFGNSLVTLLLSPSGDLPAGHDYAASPLFFAAWAGFLLTSINLFPIGQLDGGHIAYALFGERMNRVSRYLALAVMSLAVLAMPLVGLVTLGRPIWALSTPYLVWGLLLRVFLAWHPPVPAPEAKLGRGTWAIVAASAVLLALTFMPAPLSIRW